MSQQLVLDKPIFIEDDGKRVAVLLPIEMYEAMRAHQPESQPQLTATPEQPTVDEKLAAFEREAAAFERLKPELMKKYPERWVAIVSGIVVEVGNDILELDELVSQRFGDVTRYIQKVTDKLRIYRIPSSKVVRCNFATFLPTSSRIAHAFTRSTRAPLTRKPSPPQ